MKKIALVVVSVCIVVGMGAVSYAEKPAAKNSGEADFKEHCAACHPEGGNIINPKKTLLKKDREANKIKSAADIVQVMRKPGMGMTAFDAKAISDKEALEIANYILKTFK